MRPVLGVGGYSYSDMKHAEEEPVFPTLSELIDACGEEFQGMSRLGDGTWEAHLIGYSNAYGHVHGTTPEEAVARLWLAINTTT